MGVDKYVHFKQTHKHIINKLKTVESWRIKLEFPRNPLLKKTLHRESQGQSV